MNIMKNEIFIAIAISALLFGCSSDNSVVGDYEENNTSAPMSREMDALTAQKEQNPYLAYEHSISATVERSQLSEVYNQLIEACTNDEENYCTLMHSNLNRGDYGSGSLRLRVAPAGVPAYLSIVSEGGNVSGQSVSVDDLGGAILDSDKRLKMLYNYRDKLENLEGSIENDVNALIRVASELSTVQSNIEYALGQNASLLERVQKDIVNISLQSEYYDSFWRPILDSLDSFGENFAEGISITLTTLAFLLPWIFLLSLIIFVMRYIWKKRKSKASE